jgi:hypothetical protein
MKNIFLFTGDALLHLYKGSRIFNNKWFGLFLLVVFAAGCKKVTEDAGVVGVCPIVVSATPEDNTLGRSVNTTIQATFNEVMDPTTINTTTVTVTPGHNAGFRHGILFRYNGYFYSFE